jgi:hypothetical protein
MSLFYQRTETEKEVTIVFRYNAYINWLLIILLLLILIASVFGNNNFFYELFSFAVIPLIVLVALIYRIGIFRANKEIKERMQNGSVEVSGSKLSISNPLKFIIKK